MTTKIKRRRYASRYPWDLWFRRPSFSLVRGQDFFCLLHGMIGMVRNAARLKGRRVHIKVVSPNRINVTVERKEGDGGVLDVAEVSGVRSGQRGVRTA